MDLSLVAHLAILIFAFADCSHDVSCVWSAKCDGTKLAGDRERYCAVLFSCAVYCDLSVTGDDTLNNNDS